MVLSLPSRSLCCSTDMCGRVMEQRRTAIAEATKRHERSNWIKRISKQGPWDEQNDPLFYFGAPSLPMPVEQSDKESLSPFFAHLRNGGTYELNPGVDGAVTGVEPYYNTELIEFEKGVLYSDGRVDLCKMVTGPRNIGDLMESLKSNPFSKHFLLGNNIIGPTGAKAIAAFIDEFPEKFETWYLAGNCIDTAGFARLVDSMVKSPAITNVWVKRNPLGPGAAKDVFRLITQTPNLRTMDLDQTELGDKGVAELFELLTNHTPTQPLALRNLYLNATGIGHEACKQLANYLKSAHCTITSLYLSLNPIGSAASTLATGLKANTTLQRLSLQSCGLKDDDVIAIISALQFNPTLTALDIGQAYATEDLGMRFNWITDASTQALVNLVESTKLQYLNLGYTPLPQSSLNTLLAPLTTSNSILWFFAKPLTTGAKDAVSVKTGQEYHRLLKSLRERLHENVKVKYGEDMTYEQFENGYKRFLISPDDVRLIDSVYRNRDAGLARRGLKRLEKWWEAGDGTLERVADGSLV